MRIREQETGSGEAVEVRSPSLGMACQATHPVVEVIDGNEEDIGPLRSPETRPAGQYYYEKSKPGHKPWEMHRDRCSRGPSLRPAVPSLRSGCLARDR